MNWPGRPVTRTHRESTSASRRGGLVGTGQHSHRASCGCPYCMTPVLTRAVINRGPEPRPSHAQVEADVQKILEQAPDDWYGGREFTQPAMRWPCAHLHRTTYPQGTFCRDCGNWLEAS